MMKDEVKYVLNGGTLKTTTVAGLEFPAESPEAERCKEIRGILDDYANRTGSPKPLSIAVFGPPGSGKSRCVKKIAADLGGKYASLRVVNLSQLAKPDDLVKQIKGVFDSTPTPASTPVPAKPIPIIFFDEFDTPLGEKALGWLRWFLAPMQDGEFLDGDKPIKTEKAVFIFAGATAVSLKEFEERAKLDQVAYREKKVPDFISRLRSFIDVKGVNEQDKREKREVRRALALRHFLLERWTKKEEKNWEESKLEIDPERVESLLSNVHFIHGARSMEALVEMSTKREGEEIQIPSNELTKIHVGRGALDGKLIGISAGLDGDKSGELLTGITSALLGEGAKLAYGGDFEENGTLHKIVQALEDAPPDFFNREDKRILNYLGTPSFWRPVVKAAAEKHKGEVDFQELKTLSPREIEDLNLPRDQWFRARPEKDENGKEKESYQSNQHLAWAISLFRMRVRLIEDIDALIVFGGKDGESWGRFSGVAEEVMLALAFRKPVYVMGGLGGAANEIGKLLGLAHATVNPDECLKDVMPITALCPPKFKRAFAVPNLSLPETLEEMRDYFFSHSITAEGKWPWNGLSAAENRELFRADISLAEAAGEDRQNAVQKSRANCVDTIVKGLSRLEWKKSAARP
ncbi:MAG: AAA family ATPase [Armatimonadetes bacterium]|nr:AAA family ATPase [Akkermansiaceae bacterium]